MTAPKQRTRRTLRVLTGDEFRRIAAARHRATEGPYDYARRCVVTATTCLVIFCVAAILAVSIAATLGWLHPGTATGLLIAATTSGVLALGCGMCTTAWLHRRERSRR